MNGDWTEKQKVFKLMLVIMIIRIRDSSYDIATRWMEGVRFPVESKDLLYSTKFRPALGPTQPPIQWVPGALSPKVKQPECAANHSPLFWA
jgi:hypothetical protein